MTLPVRGKATRILNELTRMKYSRDIPLHDLLIAQPSILLDICKFAVSFSPELRYWLNEIGYQIRFLTDLDFVCALFRLLRTEFHYNPLMSTDKFLTSSESAEKKLDIVLDVLRFCQQKHVEIINQNKGRRRQVLPRVAKLYKQMKPTPDEQPLNPAQTPKKTKPRHRRERREKFKNVRENMGITHIPLTNHSPAAQHMTEEREETLSGSDDLSAIDVDFPTSPFRFFRVRSEEATADVVKNRMAPDLMAELSRTQQKLRNAEERIEKLTQSSHLMLEYIDRLEQRLRDPEQHSQIQVTTSQFTTEPVLSETDDVPTSVTESQDPGLSDEERTGNADDFNRSSSRLNERVKEAFGLRERFSHREEQF
ncbi:putative Centrosomal spindle body, CEP44 [Blattamonas nauphoetae]|uniref:Centrosomal protein of 44 kDa n=1 Tax=Blattamonas nauphoetae TaxID=2049346 RepID=A0ABQ9YGJ8_9EUKA|nr:putative Centrosomal spindle body, CEP44 [Blattamonas nauphoetae]